MYFVYYLSYTCILCTFYYHLSVLSLCRIKAKTLLLLYYCIIIVLSQCVGYMCPTRHMIGLNPIRTTPPCYNNTTLGNRVYAQRKGPNVTNPICWTCKNCSHKCAADCEHCVTPVSYTHLTLPTIYSV